jgi:hypothetical protein
MIGLHYRIGPPPSTAEWPASQPPSAGQVVEDEARVLDQLADLTAAFGPYEAAAMLFVKPRRVRWAA